MSLARLIFHEAPPSSLLDTSFVVVVAWHDGYNVVCLQDLLTNVSLNAADIVMKRSC